MSSPSIAQRRSTFQNLHRAGSFYTPNPWDT